MFLRFHKSAGMLKLSVAVHSITGGQFDVTTLNFVHGFWHCRGNRVLDECLPQFRVFRYKSSLKVVCFCSLLDPIIVWNNCVLIYTILYWFMPFCFDLRHFVLIYAILWRPWEKCSHDSNGTCKVSEVSNMFILVQLWRHITPKWRHICHPVSSI